MTDEDKDETEKKPAEASSDDDASDEAVRGDAEPGGAGGADDDAEEEAAAKSEPPPKKVAPKAKSATAKKPAPKKAPPPPEKSRTLVYVALALLGVGALTAYQVQSANADARMRIEAACSKLKPLEAKKLATMKEAAHTFLGEDAAAIESTIDAARVAPVCDQLPAQLQGMTWNFGKRWEPPKDPNAKKPPSPEELHDIMLKAKPRCEAKVTEMLAMFASLGDDPVPPEMKAEALSICDPESFRQEVQSDAPKAEWPPTLLEGWPKYLEGYATALGRSDAPPAADAPPNPAP